MPEQAYVEGLSQLRRLLNPIDELVAEPWRRAMTALAEAGATAGQAGSPYASGLTRSKVYARVQKKPFPMWSAVRARAKRKSRKYPRGYPYPTLLEFSAKYGHQKWFTGSVSPKLAGEAEAVLARASDEIVQNWGED